MIEKLTEEVLEYREGRPYLARSLSPAELKINELVSAINKIENYLQNQHGIPLDKLVEPGIKLENPCQFCGEKYKDFHVCNKQLK